MARGDGPTGGLFTVIESDPAAFVLVHSLGVHGLQVIEPHNGHLHSIYHLAFSRRKDNGTPSKKKPSDLSSGRVVPWGLVGEPGEQRRLCVYGDFE